MSTNLNIVTWLLDATGMSRFVAPLTIVAKPGRARSLGATRPRKQPQPPPWSHVGQLSAHLRRDIGLER